MDGVEETEAEAEADVELDGGGPKPAIPTAAAASAAAATAWARNDNRAARELELGAGSHEDARRPPCFCLALALALTLALALALAAVVLDAVAFAFAWALWATDLSREGGRDGDGVTRPRRRRLGELRVMGEEGASRAAVVTWAAACDAPRRVVRVRLEGVATAAALGDPAAPVTLPSSLSLLSSSSSSMVAAVRGGRCCLAALATVGERNAATRGVGTTLATSGWGISASDAGRIGNSVPGLRRGGD